MATACSDPPAGRARWTLELLSDALVKLTEHESLSRETVRRRLAENDLKPWRREMWCIPKAELLVVLDRPEVPLNTNGSENDIRAMVTRRKLSGGTRAEAGKQARDTFIALMKTCRKLGISYWDYLGDRLDVPTAKPVPPLADLVRQKCLAMA